MIRFPPKKILVAYDMSDVSRLAWRHAAALAARCGAALEVVYVEPWEMGVDLMLPPTLTPGDIKALRAKIRAVVGEGSRITILHGDVAQRILSLARMRRSDLIVVGTHARSGLKRIVLGSVAEDVIRGSPVPVLAARGRVRPIRSILAPVNFTPYSGYGFSYAAAASAVLSARLKVLHVNDDPIWSGNLQYRLSALIKRLPAEILKNCRPEAKAVFGKTVPVILEARRGQDWIILVAHSRSLIRDVFIGTTLEQVLRGSLIPVLSVPVSSHPLFSLSVSGGGSASRGRPLTLK